MPPLNLPPLLDHIAAKPSPVSEITNPGNSQVSSQSYSAPLIDQTRNVTAASASLHNSNGQFQTFDLNPGQQGVTVMPTVSLWPIQTSDGEVQHLTRDINDFGTSVVPTSGNGLAANVSADSQNHARPHLPVHSKLPTAITVDADKGSPRRQIPINVNIR